MLVRAAVFAFVVGCERPPVLVDAVEADPADAIQDGLPARCAPRRGSQVVATPVGVVDNAALLVTSPPNDPRLFVVDRNGIIRIVQEDVVSDQPFLVIPRSTGIDAGGEQGLLGLAFHPRYDENGTFFVFYTTTTVGPTVAHFNVLARYRASSSDRNLADPASAEILLTIPHRARNHNAGMLEFGSDGFLYVSTGDGGGGVDPDGNGQNPSALLGKILRIDVDPGDGRAYGIPLDNPFVAGNNGAPEVFVLGLRNPWRWSFDRATGELYIADVGEETVEELTILPAGSAAGRNLGWSSYEGAQCLQGPCDPVGKTFPQVTKSHAGDAWCAIVGGQVYRGPCMPDLVGRYFFTDFCAGGLWTMAAVDGVVTVPPAPMSGDFPAGISSIHADARGELYLTTVTGRLYQLEVAP